MQGKLAEAVPRFERAVALKADFSEASNDLARTLYNLDRTDEALRALARAIACNGTAETKGLFVQFLRDRLTIRRLTICNACWFRHFGALGEARQGRPGCRTPYQERCNPSPIYRARGDRVAAALVGDGAVG